MKRLVLCLVATWVCAVGAHATEYVWSGDGLDKLWTNRFNWSPDSGSPGNGDTATFAGSTDRTVTIGSSTQAVDGITVSGSARWLWDGKNDLYIGPNNFVFNSTNPNWSQFYAGLSGPGGIVINGGNFNLYTNGVNANTFTGNVYINAGRFLLGRLGTAYNGPEILGGTENVVYLGSTEPGTDDASFLVTCRADNGVVMANPIVVRAGNSGKAIIGVEYVSWGAYHARFTSSITLEKDVIFAPINHADTFIKWNWAPSIYLTASSTLTGTGNVIKENLGSLRIFGEASYEGHTIVNDGRMQLDNMDNSMTGHFFVNRGQLDVRTGRAMGNPTNAITLGSVGAFGALAVYSNMWSTTYFDRSVELTGNGGQWNGASDNGVAHRGQISGTGRLIVGIGATLTLYGTNTYSGDTFLVSGNMTPDVATKRSYGDSKNIYIYQGGALYYYNTNNLAPDATVHLMGFDDRYSWLGSRLFVYTAIPNIAPNAAGIIGLLANSTVAINGRLADASQPLGTGTVYLASAYLYGARTFNGDSLAALVANDPTHTYRLGAAISSSGYELILDRSNSEVGALTDWNGVEHNVQIGPMGGGQGASVRLNDANSFSGTLTVHPGSALFAEVPASGSPLGAASGAVWLYGNSKGEATLGVVGAGATADRSVQKGGLTYEGSAYIRMDGGADSPSYLTSMEVASLTRQNRATLSVAGFRDSLGDKERLIVNNNAPATLNGMTAAYYWNGLKGSFVDYDASDGFKSAAWDRVGLTGAGATEKVLSDGEAVPGGGASVWALRANGALTGTDTITVGSGGVILYNPDVAANNQQHTANFAFGANEGIIYTMNGTTLNNGILLYGDVTGSGGLTKSGPGVLGLMGTNTSLSGGITINDGMLVVTNAAGLGNTENTIYINGGVNSTLAFAFPANSRSDYLTNNIVLGDSGGGLGMAGASYCHVYLRGSITGTGPLFMYAGSFQNWHLESDNNSWEGGTYIGRQSTLILEPMSRVAAGGFFLGAGSENTAAENQSPRLYAYGDDTLTPDNPIYLLHYNAALFLAGTNMVLGKIEGYGTVKLGYSSRSTTVSLGADDSSFELFSDIVNFATNHPGALVKTGSGVMTFWGQGYYSGGTKVEEGTLLVNNWLNTTSMVVVVGEDARLGGIGTVGPVAVDGAGTLAPGMSTGTFVVHGLDMQRATLEIEIEGDVASGLYDQLVVYGAVSLNSSSDPEELGTTLLLKLGDYTPTVDRQWYTIIENDLMDAVAGGFWNAPNEGDTFLDESGLYTFEITYMGGDGNDVAVRLIPEPGSLSLLVLTAGLMLVRRFRRRGGWR